MHDAFFKDSKSSASKSSIVSKHSTTDSNTPNSAISHFEPELNIPDSIGVVPLNLVNLRHVDNVYEYEQEYYLKDDYLTVYKRWFKSLKGLLVKHQLQLLGRFERDLEALKQFPGLKVFAEHGLNQLKMLNYRDFSYRIKVKNLARDVVDEDQDKMVLKDHTEYVITNAEIGLNLEWHYLRKRDGEELSKYIQEKLGGVFEINCVERKMQKKRKVMSIHDINDPHDMQRRIITGPIRERCIDCKVELNEMEKFISDQQQEKVHGLEKKIFSVNKIDEKIVCGELDLFEDGFKEDMKTKVDSLKNQKIRNKKDG